MFNWYKYAQMSDINSLRLFNLDTDFSNEDLEEAFRRKKEKWQPLIGKTPEAEKVLSRIQDAYEELSNWAIHRRNKSRLDFYL